jgi:hypothetical protein
VAIATRRKFQNGANPVKLKIDTTGVSFVCTREAEQRVAFDTGQPRIDRETGRPLWQVQLMALDGSGAEIIAVTVAGDPSVTVAQPVHVEGLVALPWNQDGRSGVAYRAEAIHASGAPLSGVVAPSKSVHSPNPAASSGKTAA